MKKLNIKLLNYLAFFFILLFLLSGILYLPYVSRIRKERESTENPLSNPEPAALIEAGFQGRLNETNWGSYQRIKTDFIYWTGQLVRCFQGYSGRKAIPDLEPAEISDDTLFSREEYIIESNERSRAIREALSRLNVQLQAELESKLQKKEEQLEYEVSTAIKQKKQIFAQEIARFKGETEKEYYLKIANLQLKSRLPGLPEEDRENLQEKIDLAQEEMKKKIAAKEEEFQRELAAFAERRRISAASELDAYRQQLSFEYELCYDEEKRQLEENYRQWKENWGKAGRKKGET